MYDGYFRAAAATPKVKVADTVYNTDQICALMDEGGAKGAALMVFPELCLTGYTCNDLFLQQPLLRGAREGLSRIVRHSAGQQMLIFVGLPWDHLGKLYNVAAAVCDGKLLGLVSKTYLPNYSEFYEERHYTSGPQRPVMTGWENGETVPLGSDILFKLKGYPQLVIAAELCEDVWAPDPPSIRHALAGATVVANCSASNELVGKDGYRRDLIDGQSARLICGYVYANAGEGESTQDLVFGGRDIIAENGVELAVSDRFKPGIIIADIDLEHLDAERRRMNTYSCLKNDGYTEVEFSIDTTAMEQAQKKDLCRRIDSRPFVPHDEAERSSRCEEIFTIQAMGLKKRLEHTNTSRAIIGISGGLDSTLALLVASRAFDLLSIPRENIQAVTMPCFGTSDRTYKNACRMVKELGATLREVDIRDAVTGHFKDIGHDISIHDVTYENAQARERTQVLMDLANELGGMVVGTGDMSELALGWATYNGDHMSMYGVNSSVPKTLVRHLIRYYADNCGGPLSSILMDVLDTPVSPELLPPEEGVISQKTEDLVGPYELHDFFLYHILRFGYMPSKIYRMAKIAFAGEYDAGTILKWLNVFYNRFFAQQFKRSCLPDGPKVGSVAVSPRGDLRMPSDAAKRVWLDDLASIDPADKETD